ncbi:hypothetical protein CANINC_001256 [Pichia inconspicua]|uniref:Reverse transcriptase Ty1/copia-type domain-containing protein n=1 Tax=Pichia inconspicua TaxID=52247 RepID=A0A4T0X5S5_9ASCO|nr:hypothetical protein CANINC_001256 [[Candida] inconspicua]
MSPIREIKLYRYYESKHNASETTTKSKNTNKKARTLLHKLLLKADGYFKQETDDSEKFKARLVAKRFTQALGQNYLETFSPVISLNSIRFSLSMSTIDGWHICQMDAKIAFLNGEPKYEVYFEPPDGCGKQQNEIWKLNKALYGLKHALLIIHHTMLNEDKDFESSKLDPCIIHLQS